MGFKMKKRLIRLGALMLALLTLVMSAVSCSSGKAVMSLGKQKISSNLYELYLSRQKGTLCTTYYYGAKAKYDEFWETTIDTDGTITPREAFEEAAAILVNQYQALAGSTKVESAPTPGLEDEEDNSGLLLPIEELGLSARTANALVNNGIKNLSQLVGLSETQLKDLKGFGSKALEEVKDKITEFTK